MGVEQIRVLIVDDDALVRHALRIFVDGSPDLHVVGEGADGEEALDLAVRLRPDVVLMDLHMPRVSGIEATKHITQALDHVHVLAVTTFSTERCVVPALRAGASGYLVKDTEPDAIITAIRDVHAGRCIVSTQITRELISSLVELPATTPADRHADTLTEREMSIVQLIAHGMSNAEISTALHLAEPTVKSNLTRIMRRWGVRDRVQVLIYALTNEVIDADFLEIARASHGRL